MNAFDLFAKLTLDTSEYEKKLTSAEKEAANRWGVTTDTVAAGVTKVQKGAMMLAGAGVAAVGAFGVSAVKTGMEFDSSMSQVAATMGYTVDELNDSGSEAAQTLSNLRNFALEMGSKTAFSATQASEALNYMALAGYDANTSMAMLPNVLNLAASGGMELAAASDMVTDAQSALGLSLEETGEMVDMMAATASKSNTSVSQLGEAILTIGGTAKLMSGGTAELSTALGILADNGIKGAEGGTHLRNILLSLSAPTDTAAAELQALGVQATDAEGNMLPLQDIIQQLDAALEGMGEAEKAEIISSIFNKTDIAAVNALLGTSKDRWEELGAAIEDSEGAAEAMADVQLDNLEGSVTLLKSAFEGLKISVSDKLTPIFKTLVDWLTNVLTNMDKFGPIILGVATAFGVFAVAINISSLIRGVTGAMAAMNAVLAANPIGIIIALVAGLVAAIVTLWNTNEDFRNRVIEIWENIKQAFLDAKEAVVQAWQDIGQWFTDRWNEIVAAFGAVVEWFSSLFTGARDAVNNIWQDIGSWFSERWADITNAFAAVVDWFSEKFTAAKDAVHDAWSAIGSWFSERWSEISDAFASADSWFSEKFTAASDAVHTAWSDIGSWFTDKWTEIQNVFSDAKSIFSGIGGQIVQGLIDGITSWIGSAMETARNLIRSVKGAANTEAGIRSPSRVFRQIGQYLDEGLMLGIDDEAEGPISAMTKLMQNIIAAGDNGMNASLTSPVTGRENNSTMRRGGERYGGVNIIVNAAQGQSEESIAARVERKLAEALSQREAVWG